VARPDPDVEEIVRRRADWRCEYCQLPEADSDLPFQIDHVIARKHRGHSKPENLAYACLYCNSYKGPNLAGVDPVTEQIVRLFNPRKDKWAHHFEWQGAWLRGLSAEGRVTIQVLNINAHEALLVRENLIREGKF
jgi:hypothetical protein